MTDHIATLESIRANGFDFGFENDDYAALDAAIALMRGQSEAAAAWQRRFRRHGKDEWTPWRDCSAEDFQFYREHKTNAMGEAETRILVVAPPKDPADEQ